MPERIVMNLGAYIVPPEAIATEYGIRAGSNTKTAASHIVTSLRIHPEVPFYLSH
jgi:hypothetical protein